MEKLQKQEATARPWRYGIYPAYDNKGEKSYYPAIMHKDLFTVIDWPDLKEEDAKLIVTAVNNHDALVAQLKHAKMCIECLGSQLEKYHVPAWQYHQTVSHIEQAIAQAEIR